MRCTVSLAVMALVIGAAPVAAQDPLGDALDTVAGLWARGDAGSLAALVATDGLELELRGKPLGSISGRRVASALRRVFEDYETVSVVAAMTSRVSGTEDRAFGELVWQVRSLGGTVPERTTVFLGLVREPQGWRVSQIRILP